MRTRRARRILATALYGSGVLVFADDATPAIVGFIAAAVALATLGYLEGRTRAFLYAFLPVASAFTADVLWQLDFGPFNRDDEYEALPQTPFIFLAIPAFVLLIAVGLGVRKLHQPHQSATDS